MRLLVAGAPECFLMKWFFRFGALAVLRDDAVLFASFYHFLQIALNRNTDESGASQPAVVTQLRRFARQSLKVWE